MTGVHSFLIRTDASHKIGTGHVLRTLSLANSLKSYGQVHFACLETHGDLCYMIEDQGFGVHRLNYSSTQILWEDDIAQTKEICLKIKPQWVIVDHYGLDYRWERGLKNFCDFLLVIDDLANRKHCCDVLLDQSLGRQANAYSKLIPTICKMLLGAEYALLRSQFEISQEKILKKRIQSIARFKVLISIGGLDEANLILPILKFIEDTSEFRDLEIFVVLFSQTKNLSAIKHFVQHSELDVKLKLDVNNMAELMYHCDLAIGAGGTSLFERCCMGLPSVVMNLADNQTEIIERFFEKGAILKIDKSKPLFAQIYTNLINVMSSDQLRLELVTKSLGICDGFGREKVRDALLNFCR